MSQPDLFALPASSKSGTLKIAEVDLSGRPQRCYSASGTRSRRHALCRLVRTSETQDEQPAATAPRRQSDVRSTGIGDAATCLQRAASDCRGGWLSILRAAAIRVDGWR